MANLTYQPFANIDLKDHFFDSLRDDYLGFDDWFLRKAAAKEHVYTYYINGKLNSFLYLKVEDDIDTSIIPMMIKKARLKVGTFKIDAHGTKLGERFIKKIFDTAAEYNIDEIYVTIFPKHEGLIQLLLAYGFFLYGKKSNENVYVKHFNNIQQNIFLDYPMTKFNNVNKFVLSIYPEYHSRLFPDSILNNESYNLIQDVSSTNSIHKIYICGMQDVLSFQRGDLVLIYRTKDEHGPAKYRSVITSVCTVIEVLDMRQFTSEVDYLKYCEPYSVFTRTELKGFYSSGRYPYIIKMVYNIAFKKRVINNYLVNNLYINPSYWGVFQVDDQQFIDICKAGQVNQKLFYKK